jgi:hypothetical protein
MRRFAMIPLILLVSATTGCGWGETLGVGVSGTITYKSQPIKEGVIAFIPMGATSGPSGGANIDDGRYAVPRRAGLAPGKYRVEIRAFEQTGKETAKSTQQSQMFGRPIEQVTSDPKALEQLEKSKMEQKNIIPKRYNESSELTKELPDQSETTVNFEL